MTNLIIDAFVEKTLAHCFISFLTTVKIGSFRPLLLLHFELSSWLKIAQVYHVSEHSRLDKRVNIAVHGQSRTRIHFNKPRFEFRIDHDIKAEQLKTTFVIRYHTTVVDAGKDDNLLNFDPDLLVRNAVVSAVHSKLLETPLYPRAITS